MSKNIFLGGLALGAVLGSVAFFGLSPFGKTVVRELVGSPVGSSFNTEKIAAITFSMLTSTSTAILNPAGQFVYVKSLNIACTGLGTSLTPYSGAPGLANLNITVGTTSTASPTPVVYNEAVALNLAIATATPSFLISSSTLQTATTTTAIGWPAGTYMSFTTNATNTATCTLGVGYIGS